MCGYGLSADPNSENIDGCRSSADVDYLRILTAKMPKDAKYETSANVDYLGMLTVKKFTDANHPQIQRLQIILGSKFLGSAHL